MSGETENKALVFEGGGVLGGAIVYAVQEAIHQGFFMLPGDANTNSEVASHLIVKKFAGSSIGSAIAGLMACNASIDFLNVFLSNWNLTTIMDSLVQSELYLVKDPTVCIASKVLGVCKLPFLAIKDLWRVYYKGGAWRGNVLQAMYADAIQVLTGNRHITLKEIYEKYGNEIIIPVYNVNRKCTERFSYRNHPNCELQLVCRASMGAPFLFEFVELDGELYWDGGIDDNFPIDAFDSFDEKHNRTEINAGTLGFKLLTKTEFVHSEIYPPERPPYKPVHNIFDPMTDVIASMMSKVQRIHQEQGDFDRTIRINVHELEPFDFDLTPEKKQLMQKYGTEAVQRYLEKQRCNQEQVQIDYNE